eukprot:scaffold667_cov117-Cylindrotheca_fusiformis.AAC.9
MTLGSVSKKRTLSADSFIKSSAKKSHEIHDYAFADGQLSSFDGRSCSHGGFLDVRCEDFVVMSKFIAYRARQN